MLKPCHTIRTTPPIKAKIINETNAVTDKELLSYLNQSVEELENSINEIVDKTHQK